mmetsp:Transcript_29998/g.96796  ORF Transcript_29998/g.96796 Transcript_29998/m.96796 type:complete len:405 (+) Transcript_29998:164-1378(+)
MGPSASLPSPRVVGRRLADAGRGALWRRRRGSLGATMVFFFVPKATAAAEEDVGYRADSQPQGTTLLHRNFVSRAAAKALPAVVNITVEVSEATLFGVRRGVSAGSGFIVRDDGLVVTNAHVIRNGQSITVTLNDGRRFLGCKLVAMDRSSDVALVQIDTTRGSSPTTKGRPRLPTVSIGSSSRLVPGDFVVALGSPLNLANSVTCGIVSATARHGSEIGMAQRTDFLQVDCAINVGNSGGPLVDLDGQVVGINTMKAQMADGISFAIPIDSAWQVVRHLLKHGQVTRPVVGFKMVAVVDADGIWGTPGETKVVIAQTMPGSPADKAGVKANDVVLDFDGRPVTNVPDILARIHLDPFQRIPVTILRPNPDDPFSKPTKLHLTITTEPGGGSTMSSSSSLRPTE